MVHDPSSPQKKTPSARNPYAQILRTPGALNFSLAGVVARLPMSMVGIGTILMVENLYGSYGLAGQVSATLVIATAICAPQIARLVDRLGQRRVTLPLIAVGAVSLLGLITAALQHWTSWTLFLFAALTGATSGPFGSMVRARWSHALDDPAKLHTAYSLESAFDELVFVIGPALAAFLATAINPAAGLVVPLVAAIIGGIWFLSQRSTEPPIIVTGHGERHRSAMRSPGMIVLALIFVGMGIIFGATDVSTIAFAEEHGAAQLSGVILGVFAAGSGISGLLYGARHWISPLWRRFAIGMIALAVGVCFFFLVTSLPMLAAVMFVTGFAIAPTLINGNGLVQNLVAPTQLTEGLAWVGTSLGVGVSIGSWIAGSRIDSAIESSADGTGASAGFLVVVAAGVLAVLLTLAGLRTLRRQAPQEEVTGDPAGGDAVDAPADEETPEGGSSQGDGTAADTDRTG